MLDDAARAMSAGSRSIMSMMAPISPDGTPAAGSSSSSTLGLRPSATAISVMPLAAVGELADRPQRLVGEPEPFEQRKRLLDHGAVVRRPAA